MKKVCTVESRHAFGGSGNWSADMVQNKLDESEIWRWDHASAWFDKHGFKHIAGCKAVHKGVCACLPISIASLGVLVPLGLTCGEHKKLRKGAAKAGMARLRTATMAPPPAAAAGAST